MATKVSALALLAMLTACQTTGGSFCDIARPNRLSEATIAAMSNQEVDDALAHNRKGQKLCRWNP